MLACPNQVRCPGCNRVERVDRDEDGFADMEVARCHVGDCQNDMCGACETKCFGCDQPTCTEHLTEFGGDKWCPCCMEEIKREGAELVEEARVA